MSALTNPYNDRPIALATLHGKARVISPLFRRYLGATVVPVGVDTDILGTFAGERERKGAPIDVCIRKARMGMAEAQVSLGLATEGSFGPHPSIPFLVTHHEVMVFVDDERGLNVSEQGIFTRVVYGALDTASWEEAWQFLHTHRIGVQGGTYGCVVSDTQTPPQKVFKGLRREQEILVALRNAQNGDPSCIVRIATDMRAHHNPLRMWRIRSLAKRMALRLATPCPICRAPGFGVIGFERGLPCESCGEATDTIRRVVYGCQVCGMREEREREDGKRWAGSGECGVCNP